MNEDRVVELRHPESFSEDPLTAVLRSGAQRLLAQAVEIEVSAFIANHRHQLLTIAPGTSYTRKLVMG